MRNHFLIAFFAVLLTVFYGCKPEEPEAKFYFVQETGGRVIFTNATSGIVDGYNWKFGDGATSDEASPVHIYRASGTYEATLSVSSANGSSNYSETIEISIADEDPSEGRIGFGNADGMLFAVNNYSYVRDASGNTVEEKYGEAVAVFYDEDGFYVKTGTVAAAGNELDVSTNNTYYFSALDSTKFTADSLFYFSGDVNWSVNGGGGIPTILQTTRQGFPAVSELVPNDPATNPEEVLRSKDYLVTTANPIVGADSILYQVTDRDDNVLLSDTLDDSHTSHTFTSAELSRLGAGEAKIVVSAFNYEYFIFKKKRIYFINESVVSRNIVLK